MAALPPLPPKTISLREIQALYRRCREETPEAGGCWRWAGQEIDYQPRITVAGEQHDPRRLLLLLRTGTWVGSFVLTCGNDRCINPAHMSSIDLLLTSERAFRRTRAEWLPLAEGYRAAGYSYREIAQLLGVHYTTIGRALTGKTARPPSTPDRPPSHAQRRRNRLRPSL